MSSRVTTGTVLEGSERFLIVGQEAWPILGTTKPLPDALTQEIGRLIANFNTQPASTSAKLCGFEPAIALQLEDTAGDQCWVLICFKCDDWEFYPALGAQRTVSGDFSAIRDPLLKAMKAAFPDDALIQSIPERGSPGTTPGIFR